jgi:hypothetical protein
VGTASLRSIQLAVAYDSSRLRVISVSAGSQWPGGLFASNTDQAGVIQLGGACDATSGTKELAVIVFQAIGSGVASIQGAVTTLADGSATSIPPSGQSGRAFIAGKIAVQINGSRRRDADSTGEPLEESAAAAIVSNTVAEVVERARRAGEVCASRPCAECSVPRHTGDADGDCLFDVRDVSFQRDYLNLVASNPNDPSLAALLPIQLSNIDADGNGQRNSQDVDYLLKVNFGLYRFVTMLAVSPVTLADPQCTLSITATVLSGGAGAGDAPADPATTFVFFDIESTNSSITQQLRNSLPLTGAMTDVVKGGNYHGTLIRAESLGNGQFGVVLASALQLSGVGISILHGTVSPDGVGSNARTAPLMTNSSSATNEYAYSTSFTVVVNSKRS